ARAVAAAVVDDDQLGGEVERLEVAPHGDERRGDATGLFEGRDDEGEIRPPVAGGARACHSSQGRQRLGSGQRGNLTPRPPSLAGKGVPWRRRETSIKRGGPMAAVRLALALTIWRGIPFPAREGGA